jgi:hypothetical protein
VIDRVSENPFLVLGVDPRASRMEIEREAQKLLGMIALGFEASLTYQTPLGPRTRTAELVRAAVATLRDPAKRLAAELWASGSEPGAWSLEPGASAEPTVPPWTDAMAKLGWRGP